MESQKNELRKPLSVSIGRPSNLTRDSAWHISFMALLLVASIFMIVFATFSSAHAFTVDQKGAAFERSLGYAAVEKSKSRIGLSSDELQRETLPNVEETAFNKVILWKAAEHAGQALTEAPTPKVQPTIVIQPASENLAMSSTERNITIGFLASLFAFMMWVTTRMWRVFARGTTLKRRQF